MQIKLTEYAIDTQSIKFNSLTADAFKIPFPVGTHVMDEITGKRYIIDEFSKDKKKEDIFLDILENAIKEMKTQEQELKELAK